MRIIRSSRAVTFATLFALVSCEKPGDGQPQTDAPPDPAAARAAINAANAKAAQAMNARDRAAFLGTFSDNVTIMSVDEPDRIGRADYDSSLGAEWEAARDSGIVTSWHSDSIEVHGDYAYEVGYGMSVRRRQGSPPDTTRSKYITFWRRDGDGAWRIARDFTVMLPRPSK